MALSILEKIVQHKQEEVQMNQKKHPLHAYQDREFFHRTCSSLSQSVKKGHPFLIAEFKRKSPSKGIISEVKNPIPIVQAYASCGASAVSVLTDEFFFGGSAADLIAVRSHIDLPILRKDFIIDAYQIAEAKAMGADLILLIAAILSKTQIEDLTLYAQSLGMEVLLELHKEAELLSIHPAVHFVGVNHRNLHNFDVHLDRSASLRSQIPSSHMTIAESGILSATDAQKLLRNGYDGLLIGEYLMKSKDICRTIQSCLSPA